MNFPIDGNLPPIPSGRIRTHLPLPIDQKNVVDEYTLSNAHSFSTGFTCGFEEAWVYAYLNNLGISFSNADLNLMISLQIHKYETMEKNPIIVNRNNDWEKINEEIVSEATTEVFIAHENLDELGSDLATLIIASDKADRLIYEKQNYLNPLENPDRSIHGIRFIQLFYDWKNYENLVETLRRMRNEKPHLEKYLDGVIPVVEEIARTRGDQFAHRKFWKNMINIEDNFIKGWINCFYGFPIDQWIPLSVLKTPEFSTPIIFNDGEKFRLRGGFGGFSIENGMVSTNGVFVIRRE